MHVSCLNETNRDCFISDYANLINRYKSSFENKKRRNSEGLQTKTTKLPVVFCHVFEIEDIRSRIFNKITLF